MIMVFVPPTWWIGTLIWVSFGIPLFICAIFAGYSIIKCTVFDDDNYTKYFLICMILILILVPVTEGVGGYIWHEVYEIPSVTSEVVTVESWQVKPDAVHSDKGMMVIDNADQLMMITSDGRGFYNNENFLFQKFDTRDILNNAKPGAKINLTYYGWREGFNSGFPNILSVKVVDDSNATNVSLGDYFGTKLSLN